MGDYYVCLFGFFFFKKVSKWEKNKAFLRKEGCIFEKWKGGYQKVGIIM